MITKLIGLILTLGCIYLFRVGIKYDDSDSGHLMNIKLIGISILLFIGGLALCFTTKTPCEIFGIFC